MTLIIPQDFFDSTITHKNRIDEDTLSDKYQSPKLGTCSPGWRFTPATDSGKVHFLSCKRRSCPKCGKYWSWKWRKMLEDKALSLQRQGLPAMRRAITITTSYDPGYEKCRSALNMFWELLRKRYPGVQYWGVTEYNQEQTQPHFHFILGDDCYIPQPIVKELWEKAQRQAGFTSIAWNVYIEEIKDNSDIQRYFTKYLTKLTGGKNEIPDRDKWKGRFIRYSKRFFDWPTDVILTSLFLQQNIRDNNNYQTYYKVRPKLINDYLAQDSFVERCQEIEKRESEFINRDWNPQRDKEIAYEQMKIVDSQLTLC